MSGLAARAGRSQRRRAPRLVTLWAPRNTQQWSWTHVMLVLH